MTNFLESTESLVVFFLLLITASNTYREKKIKNYVSPITLFVILYFLLRRFYDYFFPPVVFQFYFSSAMFTLVLGGIYLFIFFRKKFTNCFVMFLSNDLCLLAIRGFSSIIADYIGTLKIPFAESFYSFFLIFYTMCIFTCIWFTKHAINYISEIPVLSITLMFISPISFYIFTESFIGYAYTNENLRFIALFFFILLLLISLFTYYLFYIVSETYHKKTEAELIQQRLELQLNNVERSIGMVEQLKRDKHEMKNVYFYIQALIKEGNISELETFVDTKLVPRYERLEEFDTGNETLDYLLAQKVSEARDYGIHTYANILIPKKLPFEPSDLTGLVMNLLDNAIDASKRETAPDIQIVMNIMKSYLSIKVKNKVSRDILSANPTLNTTKPNQNNHGYGLKIIRSIVDKYNGILNIYMKAGYFCVDVLLEIDASFVADTISNANTSN